MRKTMAVARREFTATVMTKGFVIGVLIAPLLLLLLIVVLPLVMSDKPPKISGTVAVIDRTGGEVLPGIQERITPEALAVQLQDDIREGAELAERAAERLEPGAGDAVRSGMAAAAHLLPEAPSITIEPLSPDADPEAYKPALLEWSAEKGGRLGLVVIEPDAVRRVGEEGFGAYELYVTPKLDDRIQNDVIQRNVREAIVNARIRAHGYEPENIRAIMDVSYVRPVAVTAAGERATSDIARMLVPAAFIILLMISAFTGGQNLLTTTIEEKSNRVVEVLLSAISPMQLMVGKILGQMAVGLLILTIYTALGSGALIAMALVHLLDWTNIAYLLIFFFLAFFVIAAIMAAIGSAVNDIHEAQALLGPIMAIFIVPWLLWMPIMRNPNSTLATVLSFIPAINPFVMVLRIAASGEPVPGWQIAGSIAVGLLTVVVAAWAAAKVFRIGVLMYGRPPNFTTLIRWIRMA